MKGVSILYLYIKGRCSFIGSPGSLNYGKVTLYLGFDFMTCGAQAKISSSRSEKGHPVVVFIPGSLCGWSLGRFSVVPPS
jgi:hypothetical protein